jgi:transcription initiation factor TFIIB
MILADEQELGQVFNIVKVAVQEERTRTGSHPSTAGIASLSETVEGLMGRYVNYLDLGNAVFNSAKYISGQAASKTDIDGRTYPSIAAGVLYLTCVLFGSKTSAKDLAEIAGVTDSTIKL